MLRRACWKPKDDRSCRHPGGLSRVVELEGDLRKRSEKRNGKQEQSRVRLRPGFGELVLLFLVWGKGQNPMVYNVYKLMFPY